MYALLSKNTDYSIDVAYRTMDKFIEEEDDDDDETARRGRKTQLSLLYIHL